MYTCLCLFRVCSWEVEVYFLSAFDSVDVRTDTTNRGQDMVMDFFMLALTGNDGLLLLFYFFYVMLFSLHFDLGRLSLILYLLLFLLAILSCLFPRRKRRRVHGSIDTWLIYHDTIATSAE